MNEKLESAAASAVQFARYRSGSYVPDYLTRLTYMMSYRDEARAQRLEDEVVAMAERRNPGEETPDPRVELSYEIGTNAMDLPFNDTMYIGADLLHELDDADCRAVIAHELGHAAQKTRVAAIPVVKVACNVIIPAAAVAAGVLTGLAFFTIPAVAGIWIAGRYVGKAASRSAEKHADIYSGEVTRRPADLAHALATILPDEAAPPKSFTRRLGVRCKELSMDHPATWRRIEYLNKMQQKMDRKAGQLSLVA